MTKLMIDVEESILEKVKEAKILDSEELMVLERNLKVCKVFPDYVLLNRKA